ncbi:protein IQ-DOMAIN 1-like [Coffea eugenioides]|uniref:protein IQ-DOMAIN 1-like n=1 Tax=Coffea eugenioides TaxID=49369 RepID=UPI000F60C271|nr:protein IQ-DOMAIN 1-like [Coffea eugenioides]XP_027169030.1 protein IQ-DOMAIN 1-like [Coffea eugenioides]XP_027185710.1 protein IQ-DOMAIN 1-like [Coffea eugenioides]XP_027185711.1 protein IQ-DOMAIN 1-like [Coffea eugenioides]
MGKKGGWFSAVKRVLSPESNEKKDKKTRKSKRWFGRQRSADLDAVQTENAIATPAASSTVEEVKLTEAENEQNKHAYSVALATAVAAEAAVAAAKAAAEIVRLTAAAHYSGKSKDEIAAIKIQTAFRGYMARRALRALRGLVRLKTMVQGQSVKRQATTTLRCMQALAHVQSQIHARRIRMSEENEALQRQIQQKREKELEKLRTSIGDNWNDSTQSKEQHEATLQSKHEAAIRRERALAYAYSHQQTRRNSSKSANQTFMDPNNPQWGWSWLERWMAARPWESKTAVDKELNSDRASLKSATRAASVGEFRPYYDDNKPSPSAHRQSRPPSRQSPSTPHSKTPTSSYITGKMRSPSVKGSNRLDEDSRSFCSAQSDFQRRHSIAGSSVRDDESLASSPAVPSYMAPTHSAKAKSRLPSPMGLENNGTPDKGSVSSSRKRLSFSTSPATARRHSGSPKMDASSVKDINATS